MNSETKACQNCKKDFTIEPDDFGFYEKIKVPPPTWCSFCRNIRRMTWRNERTLYKDICTLCGNSIISMYDPKNKLKIYCDKCWWSDGWDPMAYGFAYDFNQQFFLQWSKLMREVPLIQAWRFIITNSDYMNYGTECRNCYLSNSITFCENVAYSSYIDKSRDTLDSSFVYKSEWCYENVDSRNSYNSIFLQDCSDCIDSSFLYDCINCQNCFLSSNLRNKKYVFKNQQYTKSEYKAKISELKINNFLSLQKLFLEFTGMKEEKSFHRYMQAINSVKCSGNNFYNSKNLLNSFNANNSEDCKYTFRVGDSKDSMDILGAIKTELAYESVAPNFDGFGTRFSMTDRTSYDIEYSFLCSGSSHLFACIGLQNKSCCIFNRQYTKEEYEKLVPKIIEQMNKIPYIDGQGRVYKYGEFFPSELSPFCYNESMAQEYFPLIKKEIINQGHKWKEKEEKNYVLEIKSKDIPENIEDVDEKIIGKIIECEHGGKCSEQCTEAFKIIPSELQFYQRMNLPIPHLCPNCRHYQRLKQRNPLKLWHRKCMKQGCPNEFETSYAPDRLEIVYCERCYQQEVY